MSYYGVKLHRSDTLRLDQHPEACTEESFVAWCDQQVASGRRLAVDLFSGAGGLSLGVERAGWTVAMSVDNDPRALETHRAYFPGLALNIDLGDPAGRAELIGLLRKAEIDLIAGGPPCQPFSRAGRSKIKSLVDEGRRDPLDLRRELWNAYLEVVREVSPRAVLMENVPDMALGDDFRVVRTIVDKLENDGYYTEARLVDAWQYGVPQHRKRLIVLARKDSHAFTWPEPGERVVLHDAIGDLPELPENDPVGDRKLPYRDPNDKSKFLELMREGMEDNKDLVWDHMTRPVRADDLVVFRMMTAKTLYSAIPENLRRYKADTFDDKYKRLDGKDLSRSITAHIAKDGYWYIHPEQNRTLTVREAARIQTFPDRFRFAGTRSDAFRQIGNAVPPSLGEAAARALDPATGGKLREPNHWKDLHSALVEWGEKQISSKQWFLFPGTDTKQAVAAIVALVGTNRLDKREISHAFEPLRGRTKPLTREINMVSIALGSERAAARLAVLFDLVKKQKIWDEPDELGRELRLKPAERSVFHHLLGDDLMLATAPVLRLTARFFDSESDQKNRLTDGRVELARLVGGGKPAPLRMAAIRRLAASHCIVGDTPRCATCPLSEWCSYANSKEREATLF
ncbi:DNA cytosine methyltransferase [Spirillospora albida]|uniref:DNA cytosine methyltransferase n=1 Tax=Spirillospora albida TaxID=58123 RepID=UPI0004BFB998|nr:DNA cytosine methyltransferase [Spirillospora albida]